MSRTLRRLAIATATVTGSGLFLYTRKTRQFKEVSDPSIPQFTRNRPPTREESLAQLLAASDPAKALDVLVVGGGATGTGIILDLASRGGLNVALIEANDYASETSSRSSKLIHGGVRYLEKAVFGLDPMQLKLVFEALKERAVVCHQAPFLVRPLETVIPCYRPYDLGLFWCGMKTYDLLAALGGGVIGGLSGLQMPITALSHYPQLKHIRKGDTLLGAVTYYDGQHWDSRLCLHVALTAGCYGAAIVNHCRLLRVEGDNKQKILGGGGDAAAAASSSSSAVVPAAEAGLHKLLVRDSLTGAEHWVFAKTLVNATGPFSDGVRSLVKADHKPLVRPSHGTHIVLPAKYAPKDRAMLVPSSDGRVLFCINYQGHCIAGTTDVETDVREAPRAPEKDVEFILENMRPLLGDIDRSEVLSTWCGIRPLAAPEGSADGKASSSQSIVREHSIATDKVARTLSITGGKWTTYRKMAEDAVNSLMDAGLVDKSVMKVTAKASPTEDIVLYGAQRFDPTVVNLNIRSNVPFETLDHWRSTYGDQYETLYGMALEAAKHKKAAPAKAGGDVPASASAPSAVPPSSFFTPGRIEGLGEDETKMALPPAKLTRLAPSLPVLDVDVVYSARYESCERVQDFIARRSSMAFLNVRETKAAIPAIAELMAKEKKWSGSRKSAEIADAYNYLETFTPSF